MHIQTHENDARVLLHLNSYSVIQISDLPAAPIWEINTRLLSSSNRTIGARLRIRWNAIWPEEHDTVSELRAAQQNFIQVLR